MIPGPGIEPGTHWWEASVLTTVPSPMCKKNTRQCTVSVSAGPVGKLYILFNNNNLNYLLLFQFVVTGGIGCLSYKHPRKITVSILCNKQIELLSCFQSLPKILLKCFSNSYKFLIPWTY